MHGLDWDEAWEITRGTHRLHQPHAAARGARELAGAAVRAAAAAPHADHLPDQLPPPATELATAEDDRRRRRRAVSLIDETQRPAGAHGHLAFVGSHKVNGVSALHTELMKETVFKDLHALYPDRIINKTNGITAAALAASVQSRADRAPRRDDRDRRSSTTSTRCATSSRWRRRRLPGPVRRGQARPTRKRLAHADRASGSASRVDPAALFDVQVKRIHEYKRQLLNILETIALYNAIRAHPEPRLGAAGEDLRRQGGAELRTSAKLIIKLANDVARVVNDDPTVRGRAEGRVPARTTTSASPR